MSSRVLYPVHNPWFKLYLHLRFGRHRREWVPFLFLLYVIIFAAAAWVACSRIFDYKHHAVDVACGSLLGAGVAFFVVGIKLFSFCITRDTYIV